VDAELVALVAKRCHLVGEELVMPSTAYIEEWATQFDLPSAVLRRIFWSLRQTSISPEAAVSRRTQDPLGIVSIMRRVAWESFHFTVTHAVQYADSSLVSTVLVDHAASGQPLDVQVSLAIESADRVFAVHLEASQSHPPRVHQTWRVEPRLPDVTNTVTFLVIPGESHEPRWAPKVVTVTQPMAAV
jgi:hypothetical protein